MKLYYFTLFFLVPAILVGVLVEFKRRKALSKYWSRNCMGSTWLKRFPNADKHEIRGFLRMFVKAFLFKRKSLLQFSPDDMVMSIYRAAYPPNWSMGDALELESFAKDFHKRYGVDLIPLWREDMTLGDLFSLTMQRGTN